MDSNICNFPTTLWDLNEDFKLILNDVYTFKGSILIVFKVIINHNLDEKINYI